MCIQITCPYSGSNRYVRQQVVGQDGHFFYKGMISRFITSLAEPIPQQTHSAECLTLSHHHLILMTNFSMTISTWLLFVTKTKPELWKCCLSMTSLQKQK